MGDGPQLSASRPAAIAARLRALQSDLADQDPAARRSLLEEELDRAVERLGNSERAEVLAMLAEDFAPSAGPATPSGGQPTKASPPRSARAVADLLADGWTHASPDDKAAVLERLRDAGVIAATPASSGGGLTEAQEKEWRRILGLGQAEAVDPARAAQVGLAMSTTLVDLHRMVLEIWRGFAGREGDTRGAALTRLAQQAIKGDAAATARLPLEAEEFGQLVTIIVAAVQRLGPRYAQEHLTRFAVASIESDTGGGGLMRPKGVRCWEHYVSMMEGVDQETIQSDIRTMLVSIVAEMRSKAASRTGERQRA